MTSLSAPVVKASAMPAGAVASPSPDLTDSASASPKAATEGVAATPSSIASSASEPAAMQFNAPAGWKKFLEEDHGDQDFFQTKTLETINKGIKLCRDRTASWENFFPILLKALARCRQIIAEGQGNPDAEEFGKWTDCILITPLNGQYQPYGNRVNDLMRKYLTTWAKKENGKIDPKVKSHFGFGDDQTRYYLKILSRVPPPIL